MHNTMQVFPERCRKGEFFGGTFGMGGKNKRSGRLTGVQIIPDSLTTGTLTEYHLWDADWSDTSIPDSQKREVFHIKKNVEDGDGFYISIDPPVKFDHGLQVKTATNCRGVLHIE